MSNDLSLEGVITPDNVIEVVGAYGGKFRRTLITGSEELLKVSGSDRPLELKSYISSFLYGMKPEELMELAEDCRYTPRCQRKQ